MSDRSEAKFAVGQSVRVVPLPTDDVRDGLHEVAGLTGKVYEGPDWFTHASCWSYGVVVEGTEYSAVEHDLEAV